jgi:hypothetical protein
VEAGGSVRIFSTYVVSLIIVFCFQQAFEPPFDMSQDCESCEYKDIGMYNENRDDSQTIPAEAQQFYGMQGILDGHAEGTQTDSCHEYHVLKEQDLLATDRMLNTCAKELPSRGSRSGEADLNLANVQDEWNLYQGPCPSVNCGSTSSTKDDNRLSADFGSDGSKSRSGPFHNHMAIAIVHNNS